MNVQTKYIRVRHWDYWWGAYQLLEKGCPNSVEFSLTDDVEGEELFFHFDFYNLPALQSMIKEGEYMEPESPDYPVFLEKAEALKKGELEYFIGSLYYEDFFPNLEFCNQPLIEGKTIFDAKAPVAAPYYAVLFLHEEQPLVPDVLKSWIERFTQPLFGQSFSFEFADVPTKAQAQESYRDEFAHLTFGHALWAK